VWAPVVLGHGGGRPPALDLAGEQSLAALLREAVGLVTSAHDLSEGGLAQALVEATLGNDLGAVVEVPGDPFVALFAESTGRVLVTVTDDDADRLVDLADRHDIDVTPLGRTGGASLSVEGLFEVPLDELRLAWATTLPAVFG
jgi:phosphoribosylformylglycinamidine synthase